ncbi:MAG TPA: FAD:protein FMN transferase [Acidimicrobiia bacterium]|nr:FAD:protein FMN transferase [Acidimicrobiia bacterium]
MIAELARVSFPALGTTATLVATRPAGIDEGRAVLARVLAEIDRSCSRFRDDSELAHVNRAAGRPVPVSRLFLDAVDVALRGARVSAGAVDPTLGRVLRVLGYDRDFRSLADDGATPPTTIARIAGWRAVRVDREAGTVRVPADVELDLGATAKAYAADLAAEAVRAAIGGGVLVGLGGDLAVAGDVPAGGWCVRVTDDHAAGPDAAGETVAITGGGLATSSTTVRRWTRGRIELHHLVDPVTGGPANGPWRTVSVAAASCVDANIATTSAIVHGEHALDWLADRRLPARLVRRDGSVVRICGWPEPEAGAA